VNLLVFNSGSSSIKFSLFAASDESVTADPTLLLDGELSGLHTPETRLVVARKDQASEQHPASGADTPGAALGMIFAALQRSFPAAIDAVGHRVVHPGAEIADHVRITAAVLAKLEAASVFAPLHDPDAVAIVREAMKRLPQVPHFACFDTIFHQTMPAEASIYAVPKIYRDRGVKRYGFHGLSCESVVRQLRRLGSLPRRMVIAHLGSGCSVTALRDGASVDTTMGLTPTGGVVMGTRPGDLDPGLMLYLLRQQKNYADPESELEQMVNHRAGMVALAGLPNDMKAVRDAAACGNEDATLALKIFTRSVRKAIGGFAWLLGGLDAVVFTGGIGQHDAATRAEALSGSEVSINPDLNASTADDLRAIHASHSKAAVFTAPAQEDLVIALHVQRMMCAALQRPEADLVWPSA
jgi:acetate kinase